MVSALRRTYRHTSIVVLALLLLAGCTVPAAGGRHAPASAAQSQAATPRPASPAPAGLFAIDSVVRSTQLPGVDLHVRYLERTTSALVLHIAFYNNGDSDLAFVRGAPLDHARLIGSSTVTPTLVSPSLAQGVSPPDLWLVDGANNGILSFPLLADQAMTLVIPGFPEVPLRLTLPLREPPEPPAPPAGSYRFAWEVPAEQHGGRVLRLTAVTVATSTLTVEARLLDRSLAAAEQPLPSGVWLLDGRWNQLKGVTAAGTSRAGGSDLLQLQFGRPVAGDAVLLRVPGFPLVRLPLRAGDRPALAAARDVPPSARPRPAPASPLPASPSDGQPLAAIQQLLDDVNWALQQHDRSGYLAAFVPAMQAAQAAMFAQIDRLPLQDLQLTLAGVGAASGGAGTASLDDVPVTLQYAITAVDPSNVFLNELHLSFRHGAVWQITALRGDLPFWSYAPTAALRAGPFWIFFHPGAGLDLTALGREAQGAFGQVAKALPGRTTGVAVMVVTATAAEFTTLTGRPADRFAGVALSRYQLESHGVSITNQAFFLNGAALERPGGQNRARTITHELTHLVLAPTTMPFEPAWLIEGAAMAVSGDFPIAALRQWLQAHPEGIKLADFSGVTTFGQGDDSDQTLLQYGEAAFLAKYLIERYGMERFLALYDSFQSAPSGEMQAALQGARGGQNAGLIGLAQKLTLANIRGVLGLEPAALEQDFNRWLLQQMNGSP